MEKIYNFDYENRKVPLNPKLLMAQKFNAKTNHIKLDNEKPPVSDELKNLAIRNMSKQQQDTAHPSVTTKHKKQPVKPRAEA